MVSERSGTNSFEMDVTTSNYQNRTDPPNLDTSEGIKYNKLSEETVGPPKLNKHDYALIASYAYVNIMTGCVYSCLAPFFPKEAEEKGLAPSIYGFLIAVQEIVSFILCPIVGVLLPKLGLRPTLLCGSIIASIGVVFFGATYWVPAGNPFAIACGLIRGFGSIGMAGLIAGMYAAIPIFFPDHVSQVFGLLEMCYGVGMIVGPLLGGVLYEFGGFYLPFFVSGGLMFISFPLIYFLCPESKGTETSKGKAGILDILSNFRICVNILVTLVMCTIVGFSEVALEPHIRAFANLRSSTVGVIFLVAGLFYGLSTWIVGMLMPKVKDATSMSIVGLVLVIISYLFMGPMYPIPIPPSVVLVIVCQMFFGVGSSIGLVSNFTQAMREKDLSDMKDDSGAGSIISSIFVSIFSLGTAIGPIVGGQIIEYFTFAQACVFIVGLSLITLIVVILTIVFHKRPYAVTQIPTTKVVVQRLASTQHQNLSKIANVEMTVKEQSAS